MDDEIHVWACWIVGLYGLQSIDRMAKAVSLFRVHMDLIIVCELFDNRP